MCPTICPAHCITIVAEETGNQNEKRPKIFEIDERIDVNGRVITLLDEIQARAAIRAMSEGGIEAVAICTLFATVNPTHELRLREIVKEEMRV